jgi:hypothetical protein
LTSFRVWAREFCTSFSRSTLPARPDAGSTTRSAKRRQKGSACKRGMMFFIKNSSNNMSEKYLKEEILLYLHQDK